MNSLLSTIARWDFLEGGPDCLFSYGATDAESPIENRLDSVATGQEVIAGFPHEVMLLGGGVSRQIGPVRTFENAGYLTGFGQLSVQPETMDVQTFDLVSTILKVIGDRSSCRLWCYVPDINHEAADLVEQYKLFCSGRSRAFAARFGQDCDAHFSAASATGCMGDTLTIVFVASRRTVTHWENPQQMPAYRYPPEYGPRPPAFSRASSLLGENGSEWVFVSGTSAIKGCKSQLTGDINGQIAMSLENIDLVLRQFGPDLKAIQSSRRCHFKAFLRDRKDLPALLEALDSVRGSRTTHSVVEADICRSDLNVEIELTVFPDDAGSQS